MVLGGTYLEIRVGIDAEKVGCRDDGIVGRVDPSSPRIDVADRDSGQRRASNSVPDLLDVSDEDIGAHTRILLVDDAGGRDPVEILRPHGDTSDEAAELGAVGGDCGLEGGDLVGEAGVAGRGPHAQEEGGLGADRRRNSLDGAVGSAALLEWEISRTVHGSETL